MNSETIGWILHVSTAVIFISLTWSTPGKETSVGERLIFRRVSEKQEKRAAEILKECDRRGITWPKNASLAFQKQLPWSHTFSRYDVFVFILVMGAILALYFAMQLMGEMKAEREQDQWIVDLVGVFFALFLVTSLRNASSLVRGRKRTPGATVDAIASVLEEGLRDRAYEFHSEPWSMAARLRYLSRTQQRQRYLPRLRPMAPTIRAWKTLLESGEQSGKQQIVRNTIRFYEHYIDGDADSIIKEFGVTEKVHSRAWRKIQYPIEFCIFIVVIGGVVVMLHRQGISDLIVLVLIVVLTWTWGRRLGIPIAEIISKLRS
ncbi:hypothetical protein [Kineosporia succinea]|uniref:Tight adherence protein B n=1 Tax=Kineosporia succinea TaxID=84632 RepID=A0ABT9P7K1_9ACTN|nr:hypothetical protein [Kineosporia succinea]MDP9828389.1 hypothetical protein [Kineosporia succinea]